jgi:hypothetical protein
VDQYQSPDQLIDLEIRITTPWGRGGRSIEFELDSPSGRAGFHHDAVAGHTLQDPDGFQQRLFAQLEALHGGKDVDQQPILAGEVFRELTSIGRDLYQELFPREMRNLYRTFQDRVRTLLITSDEPWIPWELLRPCEFDDDDFLCMRFPMSRWLRGESPLAPHKNVRRFLALASGQGTPLPSVAAELQVLENLRLDTPGLDGSCRTDLTANQVLALFEEESFDLLHFAGHGEHDEVRAGESKIFLEDRRLRARHLSPAAERKLRQERPVVVFNSCQVGRLEHSLSGLDGWAPRWVQRWGCTAFLAPMWSVNDDRSARFAQLFYQALAAGRSIGEAVLHARGELRAEDPDEATWLAYSLYGHPLARVTFGDRPFALRPLQPLPPRSIVQRRRDRHAVPIPSRPIRSHGRTPIARRTLAFAVVLLAVTLASLAGVFHDWWPGEKSVQSPTNASIPTMEPTDRSREDAHGAEAPPPTPSETEHSVRSLPPPPLPEPEPARRPIEGASVSTVPLERIVTGRLGLIVYGDSVKQNAEVADAIESVLTGTVDGLDVLRLDDEYIGPILNRDPSIFPGDGRSIRGAENILLAKVEYREWSSSIRNLVNLRLHILAHFVTAAGKVVEMSSETQGGSGPSVEAALAHAAKLCLTTITDNLKGEVQP